jgi:hypothetical protein
MINNKQCSSCDWYDGKECTCDGRDLNYEFDYCDDYIENDGSDYEITHKSSLVQQMLSSLEAVKKWPESMKKMHEIRLKADTYFKEQLQEVENNV